MVSRLGIAAVVAVQLLAGIALAQSAELPAPDEFGRVSGGELEVLTKHGSGLSGSLSVSASRSSDPFATFGNSNGRGYGATIGGTVVPDRVWFFASAQQVASPIASRFANDLSQAHISHPIDAKAMAQIGNRSNLSASVASQIPLATFSAAPASASFLSLHYSAVISSNMFFSANISQSRASQSQVPFDLIAPR